MDNGTGSVGFFADLSAIGWLGVCIWFAYILLIFIKSNWIFYFDERKPRWEAFERFGYVPEQQYIFMTVRFICISLMVYIVGQIMVLI